MVKLVSENLTHEVPWNALNNWGHGGMHNNIVFFAATTTKGLYIPWLANYRERTLRYDPQTQQVVPNKPEHIPQSQKASQ
jgi:hypothetical protein